MSVIFMEGGMLWYEGLDTGMRLEVVFSGMNEEQFVLLEVA